MAEIRTPTFCVVCGSRLLPDESVTGYDAFTGLPNTSTKLNCTNPTVEVSGGRLNRRTYKTFHPSWVRSGDGWEQL